MRVANYLVGHVASLEMRIAVFLAGLVAWVVTLIMALAMLITQHEMPVSD